MDLRQKIMIFVNLKTEDKSVSSSGATRRGWGTVFENPKLTEDSRSYRYSQISRSELTKIKLADR